MPGLTIVLAQLQMPARDEQEIHWLIHEHIFQIKPDTVGIIKNGAMIIIRRCLVPILVGPEVRISIPSITVIARTLATIIIVVPIVAKELMR